MFYLLPALFLLLALLELWLLIQVGTVIGALPTIGLVIAISVFGAWMLHFQGMANLRAADAALKSGRIPVDAAADSAGLMLAAALIITPGLITSALGAVLLIPSVRRLAMRRLFRGVVTRTEAMHTDFAGGRSRTGSRPGPPLGPPPGPQQGSGRRGHGPVIEGEFEAVVEDEPPTPPSEPNASNRRSPWQPT